MFNWVCFIPILNVIVWIFMVSVKNKKSDSYIVGEPELNPVFLNHTWTNLFGTLSTVSFSFFLMDEGLCPLSAQQHCVKTACSSSNHPDEHDAWFISSLCCITLVCCLCVFWKCAWEDGWLIDCRPDLPTGTNKVIATWTCQGGLENG